MPHRADWLSEQLADFLGLVSSFDDPAFAAQRAVERTAEAFGAEVAAVVQADTIEAIVGLPAGAEPLALIAAADDGQEIDVPGIGSCTAYSATLADEHSAKLIVARSGRDLDPEELGLLNAMARVLGLALRMLSGVGTERALREHAERERTEREHAETNYRRLVERLPAIVYTAHAGEFGVWSYVSPQIKSLLGFTPEEWLADPTLWAKQLHPDDRERVLADELAVAQGEHTASPGDYRMLARDGRVIWFSDDAVLLHDEEGKPYWHGVMYDITYRKRAEAEVKRRAAQQEAVARLGELGLERTPLDELMRRAVTDAAEILEVDFGSVLQLKGEEEGFVVRAGIGWPEEALESASVPAGSTESHAGFTLDRGGPVIVEDWHSEQRFKQSPVVEELGVRSGLAVVIEGPERPFGIFALQGRHFRVFSAEDVNFVQSLANVLADAIEREGTEEEIRHQAVHDPLTRLPNRLLFLDRLAHALAQSRRRRSKVAVLFLDLDHFKLINDSLGHAAGDELLTAVAPRLKEALRPGDTVARFGGDEFGVLIEDVSDERDAIAVAEHIGAIFARPFILRGVEHFVTSSIGIAIAHDGNERPQSLIRDADAAMYRAKERGRGRYELFDQVMRARALERLKLENELRRALGRDELTVHYQPVVSLKTGAIVSLEALLRWNHPGRGLILPGEFILLAEESGLIEGIGRWVLEEACRQAAQWQNARPDAAPVGVAVNLSARQVAQRDLPETIEGIVRSTGIDPASLSLEITESTLVEKSEGPVTTLKAIRAMGMKLVIDDFGTGYSSLGYLERFPLDALKIDRSFIERLALQQENTAIVNAVIAMAGALSIAVVAEGVENKVQLAELRRLECGYAQGNFFSTPLPAAEVTKLLGRPYPWVGRLGSNGFRALAGDGPPSAKPTAREFGRYS